MMMMSIIRQQATKQATKLNTAASISVKAVSLLSTQSNIPSFHRSTSTDTSTTETNKFENYTLNIEHALMKNDEGRAFSALLDDDITTLEGIGPNAAQILYKLGLHTIQDLAHYKYYHMAKSIQTLAVVEGSYRPPESAMNIDGAVDKPFQTKTLKETLDSPVAALRGLSAEKGDIMAKELGVKTVEDLANFKYCKWAEAIVFLGKYDGQK